MDIVFIVLIFFLLRTIFYKLGLKILGANVSLTQVAIVSLISALITIALSSMDIIELAVNLFFVSWAFSKVLKMKMCLELVITVLVVEGLIILLLNAILWEIII